MLEELERSVRDDRDDMAAFLAELVRHETENPPGRGYEACLEAIARKLSELGFDPHVAPVPGGDRELVKRRDLEDCAVVYGSTAARLLS